ncbi:hypothetical protein [Flavobacterium sp. LM4]|uniref:hypothetical protein n=1 Tax=Flavobacterium sp. LM4 TaxID=1938609 RepID=UPI00099309BF|nr:hypothetical protein [Flavobacterium sp. LM4]OOV19888.1 hypothetical protein BXU10_09730 [Flavobacterium sp. LM4]
MKTTIILLISMITTVFYAQSSEELQSFNNVNNLVLSTIPNLTGKEYFIWEGKVGYVVVISKINNNYTYYNLELGRLSGATIKTTKSINYKPVLNKIFINFAPKPSVKRYISEYGHNGLTEHILGIDYFAIYKNGVKTFDYCLPSYLDDVVVEKPIDNDILEFLYVNVLINPDNL